jgi:hypothetical protein
VSVLSVLRGRSDLVSQRGRLILGETKAGEAGTCCYGRFPPAARVESYGTHRSMTG